MSTYRYMSISVDKSKVDTVKRYVEGYLFECGLVVNPADADTVLVLFQSVRAEDRGESDVFYCVDRLASGMYFGMPHGTYSSMRTGALEWVRAKAERAMVHGMNRALTEREDQV